MLDKHLVEVGCVGNGMLAMGRGINMSIHKKQDLLYQILQQLIKSPIIFSNGT